MRDARSHARRSGQSGLTLLEFLVAIAIVALMSTVGIRSFQSLTRSNLRSTAGKLAGSMRYLFDRASTTGKVHRLVLDFDEGKYWAEESDDRFYMPRAKEDEELRAQQLEELERQQELAAERAADGLPPLESEGEGGYSEDEEGSSGFGFGFGAATQGSNRYSIERYLPKPYKKKQAQFRQFKSMAVRTVKLKRDVKLFSLYTPRLASPMASGQGYVYFFPLGFAEAAIVHLTDESEEATFSLVVHPLTGRVKVHGKYVEPPYEDMDDEGNLLGDDR